MTKSEKTAFLLRLPASVFRQLRLKAQRSGVSLNALCNSLLAEGLTYSPRGQPGIFAPLLARLEQLFAGRLEGVILFGSEARGTARSESDVDLLIVLSEGCRIDRALYRTWDTEIPPELKRAHEREISPHFVMLPQDAHKVGSIWLESALDGVILLDRGKIAAALGRIRDLFATAERVRKSSHGHGYWVRQ